MKLMIKLIGCVYFLLLGGCLRAVNAPEPFGAVPNENQLKWHEMEFYGFIHFTVNTFTGREWGYGDESEKLFNPTEFNAEQWAEVAWQAGMKGLIITAKHHDGFCLWQTDLTQHSVKNSPWKNGEGDVLKELSAACRKYDLKMGVYLSPWDRNHADYGESAYVEFYRKQLQEVLSNYGEIFEVWHDGANGGDGYYGGANTERRIDKKTYYDWDHTWSMIRKLQPQTVIFSDAGPDVRWVGNEWGYAPETCWATINPTGMFPGIADTRILGNGSPHGDVWRPAEVDVSIRDGWFFHEDQSPKSLEKLVEIYFDSVGNGACLLLNITPDTRGLIPDDDVKRLREFGTTIEKIYQHNLAENAPVIASNVRGNAAQFSAASITDGDKTTFWATDDTVRTAELIFDLQEEHAFNCIRMQEKISLGQRISAFSVEIDTADGWQKIADGTTVGARKILRFPKITTSQIRLKIEGSLACPTLSTFEVYSFDFESR